MISFFHRAQNSCVPEKEGRNGVGVGSVFGDFNVGK